MDIRSLVISCDECLNCSATRDVSKIFDALITVNIQIMFLGNENRQLKELELKIELEFIAFSLQI